jgi:hypothetical protein
VNSSLSAEAAPTGNEQEYSKKRKLDETESDAKRKASSLFQQQRLDDGVEAAPTGNEQEYSKKRKLDETESDAKRKASSLFQQQRLDDGVDFVKNLVHVINRLAKLYGIKHHKFGQSVEHIHRIFDKFHTVLKSLLLEKPSNGFIRI